MATVIDRVDRLEEALEHFITSVGVEFNKLYNSQMRTEAELREFKEEMRRYRETTQQDTQAFKEEMRRYREDTQQDTQAFKAEMLAFKEEMREFKEENREQTRQMNRQWGEFSNRLGTLVEDLVSPSL